METDQRKQFEKFGYIGATLALAVLMFGLYGLPFFRMEGLFVAESYKPMSLSAFALIGSVFNPSLFHYSDNSTAYTDAVNEILGLYYAGGVLHWLFFIAVAAVSVIAVLSVLKRKAFYQSFSFLAMTLISFAMLVVFSVMANRVNALYQTYLGISFTQYRFFSDSMVLFGISCVGFLGCVLYEQLVLSKRKPLKKREECKICTEAEHEVYIADGEESKVVIFRGENDRTGEKPTISSARYEMSVGIKNAETIGFDDKMTDVIRKIGMPQFVDEEMTAYWWRSARSRTEYLTNKLSDIPDSELKITFGNNKTVEKVLLNANGGLFRNKNVKEKEMIGKKESYAVSELDTLADSGVFMSFYDGSFIKIRTPRFSVPVKDSGLAEVSWEAEGIVFTDLITIV